MSFAPPGPQRQYDAPQLEQLARRLRQPSGVAADQKTGDACGDDGVGFERSAESIQNSSDVEGRTDMAPRRRQLRALARAPGNQGLLATR